MPWTFNPFSGTFDQTGSSGGGASYIDGEVQNFSALPQTIGSPAVDSAYLVREAEGAWLLNRKPAGIYIRTANFGVRASDWTYAGEFPDVFSDDKFVLYDETDSSKNLVFQLSGITTGATRTLTVPNASGTIALTSSPSLTGNVTISGESAGVTGTLQVGSTTGSFSRDIELNGTGVVLRNNGSTGTVTIARAGGGTNSYTLTPPSANGTIALTSDFAAPPSIGNTTPSTGAFTTLSATPASGSALTLTGGTVTTSAPLIDATQTWNNGAVTFTGLAATITNTASATSSLVARFTVGSTNVFEVDGRGFTKVRKVSTSTEFVSVFEVLRGTTSVARIRDDGDVNANSFGITGAGNVIISSGGVGILSTGRLGFSDGTFGGTTDTDLRRDAADTLAQRRGTNAQTFRLYSTFTSTTSFERLNIAAQTGGNFIIGTEKGSGGGLARALEFRTDNTARLTIGSGGGFTLADAQDIAVGTTTGTKIGTSTTQKIGFFNATPVTQRAAIADATDAATTQARLNDLLAAMRSLGLIAT